MSEPGVEDATRRTRLAAERTYLAWWRTGLTCLAVGAGIGRLLPAHAAGSRWPFEVVGAGFALIGLAFIAIGALRTREIEKALACGVFAPPNELILFLLVCAGLLLGLGVIALVVLA